MSVELTFAQSAPRRTGLAAWLSARPTAREGVLLGLVLAVLTCLPVLVAKYPQMVDYAAHLARYYVMLERSENAFLQRYYEFDWKWSGNLGADLLVQPLAALFGLEAAGRIIAGLVPLLTALGILAVEWSLRRRIGLASLLALCFVWSPSLILGFLNFGLAQAAALFAFAAWVRLGGRGQPTPSGAGWGNRHGAVGRRAARAAPSGRLGPAVQPRAGPAPLISTPDPLPALCGAP